MHPSVVDVTKKKNVQNPNKVIQKLNLFMYAWMVGRQP